MILNEEQYRRYMEAVDDVCIECVIPSEDDPDWKGETCDDCFLRKTVAILDEHRAAGFPVPRG